MKIIKTAFATVVLILLFAMGAAGQTLKERIDQASEIKVYIQLENITSNLNTQTQIANSIGQSLCEDFKESVPLPAEFSEAMNQIIEKLNKGFSTAAFVPGNLTDIMSIPLNHEGELNWLKLGEPLTFYIHVHGTYNTRRQPGSRDREHSLELFCNLHVYAVADGRVKTVETRFLASGKSPVIKTEDCKDLNYFTKTFPPGSVIEPFKAELKENLDEFIAKQMEKYEKAMKKKGKS